MSDVPKEVVKVVGGLAAAMDRVRGKLREIKKARELHETNMAKLEELTQRSPCHELDAEDQRAIAWAIARISVLEAERTMKGYSP